jgi:hypothetical protein
MPAPCVVSELRVSVPSEPSLHQHKPQSKSTLCSRALIFIPLSPVLDSRSFARTSSDPPPPLSTVSSLMRRLTSQRSTKLSLSEAPLVSPESKSSSQTTSTARSPTSRLTPMRLLPTVLLSKLPSSLAIPPPSRPTRFFFSMLRHCLSVSRLLVAR